MKESAEKSMEFQYKSSKSHIFCANARIERKQRILTLELLWETSKENDKDEDEQQQ